MTDQNRQNRMVHLVYTRFNLAIKFGDGRGGLRRDSDASKESPWLDEDYLEKRFEIFDKYTFDSFFRQSNKNFTWFVMFHKDTPEKYKKRIKEYQNKMKQFCPMFLDDEESAGLSKIIEKNIRDHYEGCKVITTRVDNDDLVNTDFVERIQKDVGEKGNGTYFLSYVNGLQYDVRDGRITGFTYPDNHFVSLITEPERTGKHVLQYNHAYIAKEKMDVIYKKTDIPLWVEIIHENNVSNSPHWRFKDVWVPYSIKDEYESITLKWNTKAQYIVSMIQGIFLVFWNRGMGLCRMMRGKV